MLRGRPTIDVAGLHELVGSGELDGERAVLLDVREEGERAIVALPGGLWLTMDQVRGGAAVPGLAPDVRVYVYCKTGVRWGRPSTCCGSGGSTR